MSRPGTADAFPLLDISEIATCLRSLDFVVSEDIISRPQQQYTLKIYQQIADSFLGQPQKHNEPSVQLLFLTKTLYKFFSDIGVDDFCILDIAKPETFRLQRILSALINYARFREERMADCDEIMLRTEDILSKYKKVYDEHSMLKTQVTKLSHDEKDVEALTKKNEQLENELKSLKKSQELLTLEYHNYKNNKSELITKLENLNYVVLENKSNLDKLRTYSGESPQLLDNVIVDLKEQLSNQQMVLSEMEIKSRNLGISIDSFQIIENDIVALIKVLSDSVLTEQGKYNDIKLVVNDHTEQLSKSVQFADELQRRVDQLGKYISNNQEKILKLKQQNEERVAEFQQDLSLLKQRESAAQKESHEQKEIVEQLKSEIFKQEQAIEDLQLALEEETQEIDMHYEELSKHVIKYMERLSL